MKQELHNKLIRIEKEHIPNDSMSQESIKLMGEAKFYKSCRAVFDLEISSTFEAFKKSLLAQSNDLEIEIKEIDNGIRITVVPHYGTGSSKPFLFEAKADITNENIGFYYVVYDSKKPGAIIDTKYRIPVYGWDGNGIMEQIENIYKIYLSNIETLT